MNDDNPLDDLTPEELERHDAEWLAWAKEVGLGPPPKFQDEELAPPVDDELLRGLLRREFPEPTARAVLLLVVSFQSWYDAYNRVMLDEYHKSHPKPE